MPRTSVPDGDASAQSPSVSNQSQNTWRRRLFGAPRDLSDHRTMHRISVVAFLAWVGLGADGLSSSAYGPEEAFRTLGTHTYLAIPLAVLMLSTVFVISYAYSRIIEHFPHGGGGYVVATALLGKRAGVLSGSALLVDYVLTITISIAAAGDALFSFLPAHWGSAKLSLEVLFIVLLTGMNIRGVRESILILMPVFVVFLVTHAVVIAVGVCVGVSDLPATTARLQQSYHTGHSMLGFAGMIGLLLHAYSLGGGTFTGIEAVSNGLSIMREPRVQTARRTMIYMAASLAITAAGLLLCYLLYALAPQPGMTMNAVLAARVGDFLSLGQPFVIVTMLAEGALLVVAAQAGFVDGPRVLANMAIDRWAPRRFASLSERLTALNGIVLMGAAALGALLYTGGDVRQIVVMYSINVFMTFTLTEIAMCRFWVRERITHPDWKRKMSIHAIGLVMCSTILTVTVYEKFLEGGWLTLAVTGAVLMLCFLVRRHYDAVNVRLGRLNSQLVREPAILPAIPVADRALPTAGILVSGFDGLGVHLTMNIPRLFPDTFKNMVFLSVGVVDSSDFRESFSMEKVRGRLDALGEKYMALASSIGLAADFRKSVGTDVVDEACDLCIQAAAIYPNITFFAGKIVFERERWFEPFLHNQTAFAIQRRLQWAGRTMVILPVRA